MEQLLTEAKVDSDIYDLVPGFCESRKKDIKNLNSYLMAEDFNSIAKVSHTIKGIARPYGFPTLEMLIIKLENAAKLSDKITCSQVLSELNHYFKKYCI